MTDPYRHQELQFEYYEPAHMARPLMSGPIPTAIGCLLCATGVVWMVDYPLYLATLAAIGLFIAWSNRPSRDRGQPMRQSRSDES